MASNAAAYGKLDRLAGAFRKLAQPGFKMALDRALADESIRLIKQGIREHRGPDGRPWAPRVSGRGPILGGTRGRIYNSFYAVVSTTGFRIASRFPYLAVHHRGATIRAKNFPNLVFKIGNRWVSKKSVVIPRRPLMPNGRLGPLWREAFEKTTRRALRAQFRR